MRTSATRFGLTLLIAVCLVAATLLQPVAAPARTITLRVPKTVARRVVLDAARGRSVMSIRPTHMAFAWEGDDGTGVRYRTVAPGGEVSKWRRVVEDEDAARGRRHFSGAIGVSRPARVEYRTVEPRGTAIGPVTLDYVNTVDGPLRTYQVEVPARSATAAVGAPRVRTRAQWGADESITRKSGACTRDFSPVQQLFVHHTAGTNGVNNGDATMRAIQFFHIRSRGWCDVGYNFVIDWDGTIYEGRWARKYAPGAVHTGEDRRRRIVTGAHVTGFNTGSVGVSLMGEFTGRAPPRALQRGLVRLLAWEVDRHGLRARGDHLYRNPVTGRATRLKRIAGHRDAGQTACPGAKLYNLLGPIRRRVARRVTSA